MSSPEQCVVYDLENFIFDDIQVPTQMATAISMIGHFDSSFGRIEVKDATLLCKRWVCAGLTIDPDVEYPLCKNKSDIQKDDTPLREALDPLKMVWRDNDGKHAIDIMIEKTAAELNKTVYSIEVDQEMFRVQSESLSKENAHTYATNIPIQDPNHRRLANLSILFAMSDRQWCQSGNLREPIYDDCGHLTESDCYITMDESTAEDIQFTSSVLYDIGLVEAPYWCTDSYVMKQFCHAMSAYKTRYQTYLETFLYMSPAPTGSQGYSAQIVQSCGLEAHCKLPISDSDLALGFMFSPCVHFEFNPRFTSFGKYDSKVARAEFISRDNKR